jgi:hypothetical protein
MAHTFCAFIRVNFVYFFSLKDRFIGTGWLADVAIDAFIGNHQRHIKNPFLGHIAALRSARNLAVQLRTVSAAVRCAPCTATRVDGFLENV